jgi:hypothetical protein
MRLRLGASSQSARQRPKSPGGRTVEHRLSVSQANAANQIFQRRVVGTSHSPKSSVPSLTSEGEAGKRWQERTIFKENKFCAVQLPPMLGHVYSVQLAVKRQHHIGQKRPSACSIRSSKNPNLVLLSSNQARVRPGSRRDIPPMMY